MCRLAGCPCYTADGGEDTAMKSLPGERVARCAGGSARREFPDLSKRLSPAAVLAGAMAIALAMSVGFPCLAATVLPLGIEELAKGAILAIEGKVEAIRVKGDRNDIRTEVDVAVARTFKGESSGKVTFSVPGGFLPDLGLGMGVPGTPKFQPGERVFLFLEETRAGLEVCGLAQGAFHIKTVTGSGGRGGEVVEQDPAAPGTILSTAKREDPAFRILGRSVPYPIFAEMVDACVNGRPLSPDLGKLAENLPPPSSCVPDAEQSRIGGWPVAAVALAAIAFMSAVLILSRRVGSKAKKTAWLLFVAAASGAFALAMRGEDVHAYAVEGPKWDLSALGGRVPWEESTSGTNDTLYEFDDVQDAFDEWEAIPESAIAFIKTGTTSIKAKAYDGHNVIAWDPDPSYGSSILAMTYYWFNGSEMLEADIIFNDRDFYWQAGGQGGTQKVKGVALHEIGHFIGLDHVNPPPDAIMNPIDRGFQTLQDDDKAGAAYLYPASAFPNDPIVAATASPSSGPAPLTVNFSGFGQDTFEPASPLSYSWDFDDGTPASNEQNPVHEYSEPGIYVATLTVSTNRTNPDNNRSAAATATVAVGEELRPVPGKGKFKLNFRYYGRDSFRMKIYVGGLTMPFTAEKDDDDNTFPCKVTVGKGKKEYLFAMNGKGKTIPNDAGIKVKVNMKTGVASMKISKSDLTDAIGVSRLTTTEGRWIDVPVFMQIGDLSIAGIIPAWYSSKATKSGKGLF